MTVGYVDTSCLVAIALAEPGYEHVIEDLERLDEAFASNLLEAEFRAALRREGVEADGGLTGRLSWILPDRPLTAEISAVLAAGQLQGADAWHVACALYLSPRPAELAFLTLDQRQAAVVATLGFSGIR
jgi:predicted nucleic acid-binding protein